MMTPPPPATASQQSPTGPPSPPIMALAHFCESHGPRVVFVCQPLMDASGEEPTEQRAFAETVDDDQDDERDRFYGRLEEELLTLRKMDESRHSSNSSRTTSSTSTPSPSASSSESEPEDDAGPTTSLVPEPHRDEDSRSPRNYPQSSVSAAVTMAQINRLRALRLGSAKKPEPARKAGPFSQSPLRKSVESLLPHHYGRLEPDHVFAEPRCEACTSLSRPLLTNVHEQRTSFVSTQTPLLATVRRRVNAACVRVLSCETSAPLSGNADRPMPSHGPQSAKGPLTKACTRDAPMLYGDAELGGVTLSVNFRLPDSRARGFAQLYTLLLMASDRWLILEHFDWAERSMGAIVDALQEAASRHFDNEQADLSTTSVEELQRQTFIHARFQKVHVNLRDVVASRSLTTLTDQQDVFIRLHRQMMWTLRCATLPDAGNEPAPALQSPALSIAPDEEPPSTGKISTLVWATRKIAENEGPSGLSLLLRQLVECGQIAVVGGDAEMRYSILSSFGFLLPAGCVRLHPNLTEGRATENYNLIGTDDDSQSLEWLLSPNTILLRIKSAADLKDNSICFDGTPSSVGSAQNWPDVARRYAELLSNDELSADALSAAIAETRDAWLSKARQFASMQQTDGLKQTKASRQERRSAVARLLRVKKQDITVLERWQCALIASTSVGEEASQSPFTRLPKRARREHDEELDEQ